MRRFTFLLALLLALSPLTAADASVRNCNVTLVNQQVCRDAGNTVLFYDAPTAALIDLRSAIVEGNNYQDEIICASTRQFEPLLNSQPSKVLNAAGASQDGCTAGQVTANPQTDTEFADAVIDAYLRNLVIAWKHSQAVEQQDPSMIPTPDTGGGAP